MNWKALIEKVISMALGAAGAFWFSNFYWGDEKAANAAHIMSAIWAPAMLLQAFIDRKAAND